MSNADVEDVEESLDVPTWCPKCGRRAGTCTCEPFKRLRKKVRTLRERLEEVEEERERLKCKVNKWIFRRAAARRRADRLEEAVREAANLLGTSVPTEQIERVLLNALDSREDEGEPEVFDEIREALDELEERDQPDCTCGTYPHKRPGRIARVPDPDCPAHADEPEGDERGVAAEAGLRPLPEMRPVGESEGADNPPWKPTAEIVRRWAEVRKKNGDYDAYTRLVVIARELEDRPPPTDEPVSGEGETQTGDPRNTSSTSEVEVEPTRDQLLAAIDLFADDQLFFAREGEDGDPYPVLILNDTFGWAVADGERIPWGEVPALRDKIREEGWPAGVEWAAERRDEEPIEPVQEAMEEHDPPTDEPVSREGESIYDEVDRDPIGAAIEDLEAFRGVLLNHQASHKRDPGYTVEALRRLVPTHADARSEVPSGSVDDDELDNLAGMVNNVRHHGDSVHPDLREKILWAAEQTLRQLHRRLSDRHEDEGEG